MIDKAYSKYELICDACGEYADCDFDNFQEALDYITANAWKASKKCGEWVHVCPDCIACFSDDYKEDI